MFKINTENRASKALSDLENELHLKNQKIANMQKKIDYLLSKNKELEDLLNKTVK